MMQYVRQKRKKKWIVFTVFLLLCLAIYSFTSLYVRPVIRTVSEDAVKSLAVQTVNQSVSQVMRDNADYVQLTKIVKDEQGNILLIQTDSAVVNALARAVTDSVQQNLTHMGDEGIGIPLGSLSGVSFLAGRGSTVKIKAVPVGSIDTAFSSQFIASGINQTLHRMFIDITATVNIIIPGVENKITTVTQVLVNESIIIGKVPDVYFSQQAVKGTYNLVP